MHDLLLDQAFERLIGMFDTWNTPSIEMWTVVTQSCLTQQCRVRPSSKTRLSLSLNTQILQLKITQAGAEVRQGRSARQGQFSRQNKVCFLSLNRGGCFSALQLTETIDGSTSACDVHMHEKDFQASDRSACLAISRTLEKYADILTFWRPI
jgi:hypothetical protein